MTPQTVRLLTPAGHLVATARIAPESGYYAGSIDLTPTPPEVRALFEEFEEAVTGQMFFFVDDIQDRIAALISQAQFGDGSTAVIDDLQVYPSTGAVSFSVLVSAPVR